MYINQIKEPVKWMNIFFTLNYSLFFISNVYATRQKEKFTYSLATFVMPTQNWFSSSYSNFSLFLSTLFSSFSACSWTSLHPSRILCGTNKKKDCSYCTVYKAIMTATIRGSSIYRWQPAWSHFACNSVSMRTRKSVVYVACVIDMESAACMEKVIKEQKKIEIHVH